MAVAIQELGNQQVPHKQKRGVIIPFLGGYSPEPEPQASTSELAVFLLSQEPDLSCRELADITERDLTSVSNAVTRLRRSGNLPKPTQEQTMNARKRSHAGRNTTTFNILMSGLEEGLSLPTIAAKFHIKHSRLTSALNNARHKGRLPHPSDDEVRMARSRSHKGKISVRMMEVKRGKLTEEEKRQVELLDSARVLPSIYGEPQLEEFLKKHNLKEPADFRNYSFVRTYYAAAISENVIGKDGPRPLISKDEVVKLYSKIDSKVFERMQAYIELIDSSIPELKTAFNEVPLDLGYIFEKHRHLMIRAARRMTQNPEEIFDILQDAMVKVIMSNPETLNVGYVLRAINSACVDFMRRERGIGNVKVTVPLIMDGEIDKKKENPVWPVYHGYTQSAEDEFFQELSFEEVNSALDHRYALLGDRVDGKNAKVLAKLHHSTGASINQKIVRQRKSVKRELEERKAGEITIYTSAGRSS